MILIVIENIIWTNCKCFWERRTILTIQDDGWCNCYNYKANTIKKSWTNFYLIFFRLKKIFCFAMFNLMVNLKKTTLAPRIPFRAPYHRPNGRASGQPKRHCVVTTGHAARFLRYRWGESAMLLGRIECGNGGDYVIQSINVCGWVVGWLMCAILGKTGARSFGGGRKGLRWKFNHWICWIRYGRCFFFPWSGSAPRETHASAGWFRCRRLRCVVWHNVSNPRQGITQRHERASCGDWKRNQ